MLQLFPYYFFKADFSVGCLDAFGNIAAKLLYTHILLRAVNLKLISVVCNLCAHCARFSISNKYNIFVRLIGWQIRREKCSVAEVQCSHTSCVLSSIRETDNDVHKFFFDLKTKTSF